MRTAILALALALLPLTLAHAQTSERRLAYGVTGSVTSQGYQNPTVLLGRPEVQRAVLAAARDGIGERDLTATLALAGDVSADHLLAAQIFRRDDAGRYHVAFNLVTAQDHELINNAIAPYVDSLTDAILRRRARLDALFARYDLAGIDRRQLAFALVGCVALDWDGLDLTEELGLRAPANVWPNGDRFVLWAREQGPTVSYRGVYWGSHNSQRNGAVWFTTFGDHDALPRSALPDAANEVSAALNGSRLEPDARNALRVYLAPRVQRLIDQAAPVMLALRDGPTNAANLARRSEVALIDAEETLNVLQGLGYVRAEEDGRYAAAIVVLGEQDRAMVEAVRAEMRAIMRGWLRINAERLRADLAGLSAVRAGVAYEQLFTQIWHYQFGVTNLRLSQEGFITDAYAEDAAWRGFVPFVWASSLELYE